MSGATVANIIKIVICSCSSIEISHQTRHTLYMGVSTPYLYSRHWLLHGDNNNTCIKVLALHAIKLGNMLIAAV